MLGLGNSLQKTGLKKLKPGIVTSGLVLKQNYDLGAVVPISDGSAFFDGTNDYVDISIDNFCGADFSIGYWSKNDGSSPDYWKGLSLSTTYQEGMFIAHHRILGQDALGNAWDKSFPSLDGVNGGPYGEWHYRAVTYDISEKTFTLYVDDATPTTKTLVGNLKTDEDILRIGRNTSYYFDGNICNVGIWSAVLTAAQIKSIMYKNYAGLNTSETTNLVSWWNLSADANDNHGSNNGTLS